MAHGRGGSGRGFGYARGMQLEEGVRFELRLAAETQESAAFQLELRLPDAAWQGEATIGGTSGVVAITFAAGEPPPAWCTQAVRAALRTLFRERAAGKRYPQRITRWRPAPTAGDVE